MRELAGWAASLRLKEGEKARGEYPRLLSAQWKEASAKLSECPQATASHQMIPKSPKNGQPLYPCCREQLVGSMLLTSCKDRFQSAVRGT